MGLLYQYSPALQRPSKYIQLTSSPLYDSVTESDSDRDSDQDRQSIMEGSRKDSSQSAGQPAGLKQRPMLWWGLRVCWLPGWGNLWVNTQFPGRRIEVVSDVRRSSNPSAFLGRNSVVADGSKPFDI